MCLQLPIEDRTQLCNILQESITRERKERPAFLKRMMAEVLELMTSLSRAGGRSLSGRGASLHISWSRRG